MTFAKKLPMECTNFAEMEVNQHFRKNWQLKFSTPVIQIATANIYIYSRSTTTRSMKKRAVRKYTAAVRQQKYQQHPP
jgi:hypothetical protein